MSHRASTRAASTPFKRNTAANALRRGRASIADHNYFVTLCVHTHRPILVGRTAEQILQEARAMDRDATWALRCMSVMPDHVHFLITLGERLTLSQAMGRLKVKTQRSLSEIGGMWQQNYYDHRLRGDDPVEAVMRYIYGNPYRANLVETGDVWPHFYCCADDWSWFEALTDSGRPFPEWLREC